MGLLRKKKKDSIRSYKPLNDSNLQRNNYYRSTKSKQASLKASPNSKKPKANKNDKITTGKQKLNISSFINTLIVISAFCLVVFATTLNNSPIVDVVQSNNVSYSLSDYEKKTKEILKSDILNNNKITFQRGEFEAKLKGEFPEINTVRASVPIGGRSLSVSLILSEPFAYVSSGENNGIINSDGILVKVGSEETLPSGLLKLRFTQPQENFTRGSRLLTNSEVDLLKTLNREMTSLTFKNSKDGSISEVLFNVADGQLEAKLNNQVFFIKLSSFNSGDVQVGGAKATLEQLDKEDKLPTQYIDVRVPGRSFVQ